MTPTELRVAVSLLTGDAKAVAADIGYSRRYLYDLLDGSRAVRPNVAERVSDLLRQRRDAIDAVLDGSLKEPRQTGTVSALRSCGLGTESA